MIVEYMGALFKPVHEGCPVDDPEYDCTNAPYSAGAYPLTTSYGELPHACMSRMLMCINMKEAKEVK